jgi:OmcA/MtrC family decaheme c-type cytochrome
MRLCRSLFIILALTLAAAPAAHGQSAPDGGLKAEITAVAIPANRRPVVTFKIADAKGRPLDLEDLDPNSVKFTIAALTVAKSGARDYRNYILAKVAGKDFVFKGETRKPALAATLQPGADEGGALARVGPGVFTYTFKTALPADFDRRATHVVGGELTRAGRIYAANPLYEFVPAGGRVQLRRELTETASCNACHDPMRAHRGTAREAGYCALCHTAHLADPETAESLDFNYFIHKLHRGKYLPSVKSGKPYFTVGLNQRVADFSTIVYPRSVVTDKIQK